MPVAKLTSLGDGFTRLKGSINVSTNISFILDTSALKLSLILFSLIEEQSINFP